MNLLKALEGLSADRTDKAADETPAEKPKSPPRESAPPETHNVMASVLERHERISNRVRNGRV